MTNALTYALATALLLCGLKVKGTTIIVGPGSTQTITEALSLAHDCDTIRVTLGTYKEGTITIDRPVVLLGEGWPVVDGEAIGDVISVTASHVVIEGFVLRGTEISDMNEHAAINAVGLTDLVVSV